MFYTDGYQLETSYWRLLLALALMLLWCVVLMRKGLYGRYMLTNWVVGITCSLVTFIALYLPALDHAVSFRKIVDSSMPYLSNSIKYDCVLTNESNKLQNALWYYYADLILVPTNDYKHANRCQTLLLWSADSHPQGWNLVWTAKRVIDKKSFLIFYKKHV
jgi:hypothetical protein